MLWNVGELTRTQKSQTSVHFTKKYRMDQTLIAVGTLYKAEEANPSTMSQDAEEDGGLCDVSMTV